MIDNDNDSRNTRLFDVPYSTILSVIRGNNEDIPHQINLNLLQVTVNNQLIVFDLSEAKPKEVFFF